MASQEKNTKQTISIDDVLDVDSADAYMGCGPDRLAEVLNFNERLFRSTLRDQFAMAALTGILSITGGMAEGERGTIPAFVSDLAYETADAMMEARKPKPSADKGRW